MSFASIFDSTPDKPNGFDGLAAFDKVAAADGFKPLPPGYYAVRILSGRMDNTRKGDACYRITFEVTEGEHRGRRLYRVLTFTEKALAYVKRDLIAFGLTTKQELLSPFPRPGEEIRLRVLVALQRGDEGIEYNDIKNFLDIRREAITLPAGAGGSPFGQFSLDEPAAEGGADAPPF